MALIDRGGSVRAAAVSVGVQPDQGYQWMRQAGLSTPRSTQRRYISLVERERLKDLMMVGLSIRQVAAEMGRSPSTISRELRRNTVSKSGYLPHTTHRISGKRRQRSSTAKG